MCVTVVCLSIVCSRGCQELDSTVLSASLKPVLRKALDTLGKRAGAEKRAALQATYDRSISAVSPPPQPQPPYSMQ